MVKISGTEENTLQAVWIWDVGDTCFFCAQYFLFFAVNLLHAFTKQLRNLTEEALANALFRMDSVDPIAY